MIHHKYVTKNLEHAKGKYMVSKQNGTTKEEAFLALRDKIILFEYPPETIMTEKALSQEFGITRTTLKEIIYRLEEMDLVELIPRVGIKVTQIDFNALVKDYEVMVYLGKMAGTLAARHMTVEQIKQIGELIDQLVAIYDDPALRDDEFKDFHLEHLLHKMVHENCRNPTLMKFLDTLHGRVLRMVYTISIHNNPEVTKKKLGIKELKEFHKMLVERDDEKAGFFFAEHSKKYLDAIRKKLSAESYL